MVVENEAIQTMLPLYYPDMERRTIVIELLDRISPDPLIHAKVAVGDLIAANEAQIESGMSMASESNQWLDGNTLAEVRRLHRLGDDIGAICVISDTMDVSKVIPGSAQRSINRGERELAEILQEYTIPQDNRKTLPAFGYGKRLHWMLLRIITHGLDINTDSFQPILGVDGGRVNRISFEEFQPELIDLSAVKLKEDKSEDSEGDDEFKVPRVKQVLIEHPITPPEKGETLINWVVRSIQDSREVIIDGVGKIPDTSEEIAIMCINPDYQEALCNIACALIVMFGIDEVNMDLVHDNKDGTGILRFDNFTNFAVINLLSMARLVEAFALHGEDPYLEAATFSELSTGNLIFDTTDLPENEDGDDILIVGSRTYDLLSIRWPVDADGDQDRRPSLGVFSEYTNGAFGRVVHNRRLYPTHAIEARILQEHAEKKPLNRNLWTTLQQLYLYVGDTVFDDIEFFIDDIKAIVGDFGGEQQSELKQIRNLTSRLGFVCERVLMRVWANGLPELSTKEVSTLDKSVSEIRARLKPVATNNLHRNDEISPYYQGLVDPVGIESLLDGNITLSNDHLANIVRTLETVFSDEFGNHSLLAMFDEIGEDFPGSGTIDPKVRYVVEAALALSSLLVDPIQPPAGIVIPNQRFMMDGGTFSQFDGVVIPSNTPESVTGSFSINEYVVSDKPWALIQVKFPTRVKYVSGPNKLTKVLSRSLAQVERQIARLIVHVDSSDFNFPQYAQFAYLRGTQDTRVHTVRFNLELLSQWFLELHSMLTHGSFDYDDETKRQANTVLKALAKKIRAQQLERKQMMQRHTEEASEHGDTKQESIFSHILRVQGKEMKYYPTDED